MKQFVVLMLCCAAVALATSFPKFDLPIGFQVPSFNDNPTPCCLPKQWQGNMTGQLGKSSGRRADFRDRNTMVFVDETNKKIAGRATVGCHRNETGGFVMRFNSDGSGDVFAFNMNKQKCFKKHLDKATFHDQCIPQNATYDGDFSLGPKSGGLSVQSWSFRGGKRTEHGSFFVGGKILVAPNNCIPVYVQDHGMAHGGHHPHSSSSSEEENEVSFDEDYPEEKRPGRRPGPGHRGGMAFVASVYFSNVDASIKDPSVFTPPSYCNATYEAVDPMKAFCEDEPFTDILTRFVDIE
jgi:hypothetical protein